MDVKHVQPEELVREHGRRIYVYRFRKGEGLLVHDHPFSHEVKVFIGEIEIQHGAENRRLHAGDSFVFEPGVPHGIIALQTSLVHTVFDEAEVKRYEPDLPDTLC